MNRIPLAGRLAVVALSLVVSAPALAAKLTVRSFDSTAYAEKSTLAFLVDARDEAGPVEGLGKADWGLEFGEKVLKVAASAEGYRAREAVTSILFLVPATANFVGRDEPDAAKDRSRTPLRYVLDGLQSLKTSIDDKDFLAVGCYDETRADPVRLSDGVKKAASVTLPSDAQAAGDRCAFGGGQAGAAARLPTLLAGAIKQWMAKKAEAQRFVVVLVSDGASSEPVNAAWAKGLLGDTEGRWLELYVVGLEDGGDLNNLQALGSAGVSSTVPVRQNLPSELAKLGPWIGGAGVYAVSYTLDDPIRSKSAELVLTAGQGKTALRSDPAPVGKLEPKTSWLKTVLLVAVVLVVLVIVVLVIRFVVQGAAARRRRREEEEARRKTEQYDGPSRGRLQVREGPAQNQTFHLVDDVTYIGRSNENHVTLQDPSLSKRHCSITIRDRSYQLEDLQSVNGVIVNGQKIVKVFLKDGDSIRLGGSEMQFRL
jgi:hypothetical protein